MDQQNKNKPHQIYTDHWLMDLATRRTTILSALNSIAASVYIIRGNNLKGAGVGEGVYALILVYAREINEVAVIVIS